MHKVVVLFVVADEIIPVVLPQKSVWADGKFFGLGYDLALFPCLAAAIGAVYLFLCGNSPLNFVNIIVYFFVLFLFAVFDKKLTLNFGPLVFAETPAEVFDQLAALLSGDKFGRKHGITEQAYLHRIPVPGNKIKPAFCRTGL